MKNYPEPDSKIWDIAEAAMLWTIAALMVVSVYFAVSFAKNIILG